MTGLSVGLPDSLNPLHSAEAVVDFARPGVSAWTTTRGSGSFGLASSEPVEQVMHRFGSLLDALAEHGVDRLATASQVHEAGVSVHHDGWRGWLRQRGIDGHITTVKGTALAVTVADCTPVFIAHPAGAIAVLHAGWRGTAARILQVGCDRLRSLGFPPEECFVHLGPSICKSCYEVGPEVLTAVTGRPATEKGTLDVRAILTQQAHELGITSLSVSRWCTRCDGDRFFSHRGGDAGRQLGVIALY